MSRLPPTTGSRLPGERTTPPTPTTSGLRPLNLLAKLDWFRRGGGTSDRQWRDVLGVLKVQAERLDRAYLRDWAGQSEVADLLRRAPDHAGLPPDEGNPP